MIVARAWHVRKVRPEDAGGRLFLGTQDRQASVTYVARVLESRWKCVLSAWPAVLYQQLFRMFARALFAFSDATQKSCRSSARRSVRTSRNRRRRLLYRRRTRWRERRIGEQVCNACAPLPEEAGTMAAIEVRHARTMPCRLNFPEPTPRRSRAAICSASVHCPSADFR